MSCKCRHTFERFHIPDFNGDITGSRCQFLTVFGEGDRPNSILMSSINISFTLESVGVPDLQDSIRSSSHNFKSIRGISEDIGTVSSFKISSSFTEVGVSIPDLQSSVTTGGGDISIIWAELAWEDPFGVSSENSLAGQALCVPDLNSGIVGSRCDFVSLLRVHHGVDEISVSF